MPEKRTALTVKYRRREKRFAKLMAIPEQEAKKALYSEPVTDRRLPVQDRGHYRKADKTERRTYYRAFSRAFGHRLEALTEEQRTLLLYRCRDGLSWEKACQKSGYSESGAMKIYRKLTENEP